MPEAVSQDYLRDYIIAAHYDLPKVKSVIEEHPELLEVGYAWTPEDVETGLLAAAHVGNSAIMQFYLMQGVKLHIFAAAALGYARQVREFLLDNPALANARGAHGIPLLYHAAVSGNTEVGDVLLEYGGGEGASFALHGAVAYGHYDMVLWLLEHDGKADLSVKNFESKSPLQKARELGYEEIVQLLQEFGAQE